MSKILVIGVGNAGRNVALKLKDDGLSDAEFVTIGGFQQDERYDIPHHNLIYMNGYPGLCNAPDEQIFRKFANNKKDEIKEILEELL